MDAAVAITILAKINVESRQVTRVVNSHQAIEKITDGSSSLVSGFVLRGPQRPAEGPSGQGVKNLTIITNDSGLPGEMQYGHLWKPDE